MSRYRCASIERRTPDSWPEETDHGSKAARIRAIDFPLDGIYGDSDIRHRGNVSRNCHPTIDDIPDGIKAPFANGVEISLINFSVTVNFRRLTT